MSFEKSLSLKFRPSQLEDLVGQKHVISTLIKASENNAFVHTYLFSGNHGSGKTSSARILANLITCENPSNGKTCGKCRSCKTVPFGASIDVIELDGATKRGIDDIKDLKEGASWSPTELSKKIYIIDECHMLSREATAALLKVTEEPPEHLVFILCTTEINKIPQTILSRCQKFNFRKIYSKDIANRLIFIAKKENINIEEKAIYSIAQMSRGSMRDAIGYLEQIATLAQDKEIKQNHIQKYFGVADRLGIMNMIRAMVAGDIALLMDQVNDMIIASVDCKSILLEISEVLRNITLLGVNGLNKESIIDLPDYEIEELEKIRKAVDHNKMLKLAAVFSSIEKEISVNINERWIMEATLIKCSNFISQNQVV